MNNLILTFLLHIYNTQINYNTEIEPKTQIIMIYIYIYTNSPSNLIIYSWFRFSLLYVLYNACIN